MFGWLGSRGWDGDVGGVDFFFVFVWFCFVWLVRVFLGVVGVIGVDGGCVLFWV